MPSVSVNGTSIYYKEVGRGEPMVLVHGTGASADAWDPVLPLLGITYRTITYDRRGYQRSEGPPPATKHYHLRHGEDLGELLKAWDATPATVVGWSAGSFTAFHAAIKYPGRIKQLILYEPPLYAAKNITWPLFKTFALVGLWKAIGRPQAGADAFLRMAMAYRDGRNSFDHLPPELHVSMAKDTATLLAELAAGTGEEFDATALPAQITVPVKLLVGECSPELFHLAMQRLRSMFPLAPVITIPGGNHIAQVDRPEAFVESLNAAISA